jgi:lysophospholipase L1-like esterase
MRRVIFTYFVVSLLLHVNAQQKISWWDPASHPEPVIEGQAWLQDGGHYYARLPKEAKETVRSAVWNLSRNSAGLSIRFRTNSSQIRIQYGVAGELSLPHMPATGVSGVDVYAKDGNGAWSWCRGNYSFGDTIKYDFLQLKSQEEYHDWGREYRLYLPLYNTVEWLQIGVEEGKSFEVLPLRLEKPVVVYGTSIAQGACASRPGMAWTNILSRMLDRPVVNLGFSGNGRLEEELIDLMAEQDAKLYVLDCLPNMVPGLGFSPEVTHERIRACVKQLRQKRPGVPILLTEHSGYSDGALNPKRKSVYKALNKVMKQAFEELLVAGEDQLFLLTREALNLGLESYVDGTHPSDLGMMQYAVAYEKIIRDIIMAPKGESATTLPVTQLRERQNDDWEKRHQEMLRLNRENPPDVCLLANSIVHYWGGTPKAPFARGADAWDQLFGALNVRNMACGWDRIENVLWRINHDALDGFQASQVILMIGTNNLHLNSDDEIIDGLRLLIRAVKHKQPNSVVTVFGVLPRRNQEERIKLLNQEIARLCSLLRVQYGNVGQEFLRADGKIDEALFSDGLHPNAKGYQKLGTALKPYVVVSP